MPTAMPRTPPTVGTVEPLTPPLPPRRERKRSRAWLWLLCLALAPVVASHLLVLALRWLPPPTTAFMLQSPTQPVRYQWVDATQMAEVASRAVVAAEDQLFREHGGFDFEAIEKAIEHNQSNRRKRGASTISQQVAKNLFLWEGHSWLRKGLEVYATLLIEWIWGKDRILEVYLNVAEFGPGIYGIEAASRHYFDRPASQLQAGQAARLAAVLPSPRRWSVMQPGAFVLKRSDWILGQMGYRQGPAPAPADDGTNPPLHGTGEDAEDDSSEGSDAENPPDESMETEEAEAAEVREEPGAPDDGGGNEPESP